MESRKNWKGVFLFDPEDRIYETHFPSNAVVPGSVIIHAFIKAAGNFGYPEKPAGIENFRFRQFISPGEYTWQMDALDDGLSCRIVKHNKPVVTGKLKYIQR